MPKATTTITRHTTGAAKRHLAAALKTQGQQKQQEQKHQQQTQRTRVRCPPINIFGAETKDLQNLCKWAVILRLR